MIKTILFDCDGPIVKRDKYFSLRLRDIGIPINVEKVTQFFTNEFLLCETGKADLKVELKDRIKDWGWEKSLDELLDFWFSGEAFIDPKMAQSITELRGKGIRCFLTTDQEKYRTAYLWQTLGLNKILERIYSSCEVGFLKKDIQFWEKVCKDLPPCKKDEILVIDDDEKGLAAAKSVGLKTLFYTNFENYKKDSEEILNNGKSGI